MKSSKLIFVFIGIVMVILLAYILKESFSQPGKERFNGKFEEMGFYRSENNTGPVIRIYAVRVLEPNEELMREFGNAQPHTKYGRTLVFFFSSQAGNDVGLSPKPPYFSTELQSHLISTYEKTPMGEVRFVKGLLQ